nr:MAG TPA: hypothetical protein [Bacteriophage sp.]
MHSHKRSLHYQSLCTPQTHILAAVFFVKEKIRPLVRFFHTKKILIFFKFF